MRGEDWRDEGGEEGRGEGGECRVKALGQETAGEVVLGGQARVQAWAVIC